MTEGSDCQQCRELKEKLRILSLENDQMAERGEETLLLGLIAEKISQASDVNSLVDTGLEQIAILKDLACCAFCLMEDDSGRIIRSYNSMSHAAPDNKLLQISPAVFTELKNGNVMLTGEDCQQVQLPHEITADMQPGAIFMVPFAIRQGKSYFFIFVDNIGDVRFQQMRHLLHRAADMIVSRYDILLLLAELRELNLDLDRKVNERTRDLVAANKFLRNSEQRFRTLVESAADAIFVLNDNLKVMDVNEQACNSLGYTKKELLTLSVYDLDDSIDLAAGRHLISEMAKGNIQIVNGIHRRKDGSTFPVEIRAGLLKSNEGQYFIALARDISQRQILEEQLVQAQKMEAVGRLAGGIAHDFNNILTTIMGYSEMALLELADGHPLREDIEMIKEAGSKATLLTRQLLLFSRKQVITMEPVNLNEVITGIAKMLGRMIGEDVEVVLDIEPRPGNVKGDAGKLEQVVMNLVINARDAMPDGGKITVMTRCLPSPARFVDVPELGHEHTGNHLVLTVSDTGGGIPPEILKNIFEPFFTTKDSGKGTGLGLATVYGITKQHFGHIEVESTVGAGTTFRVYLPEIHGTAEKDTSGPEAMPRGNHEMILLVEDDEMIRQMLSALIKKLGYELLIAEDGMEALAVANNHDGHIDLLLTDVIMPKMNGGELVEKFKPTHSHSKVIYMSGYTDDMIGKHGVLEEGMNFLQKPVSFNDLAVKLREVLEG